MLPVYHQYYLQVIISNSATVRNINMLHNLDPFNVNRTDYRYEYPSQEPTM